MYLLDFCFESRKLSRENRKRIYILLSNINFLRSVCLKHYWSAVIYCYCVNAWYIYERLDSFISSKLSVFLVLFYTRNNEIINKNLTSSWDQSLRILGYVTTKKKNERASFHRSEDPTKPFAVSCAATWITNSVINMTEKTIPKTKC